MADDRYLLKGNLQEYADRTLTRSRGGLYCCPLCGSGTGRNRTGALGLYGEDNTRWKCQACGAGGDIIDLIAATNNIDTAEAFTLAREMFGGAAQTAAARAYNTPATYKKQKVHNAHEVHADYTAYIEASRKALQQSPEALTYLQGRGISETTAARACLGFDQRTRSIVIPYSRDGSYYTTRSIEGKAYRKPKTAEAGPQPLYNGADLYNPAAAPVFVLEGEIDALSVIEAGGHAVALCGAKNGRKLLQEIEAKVPAGVIVLSLDNDEAGRAASDELAGEMDRRGVPFLVANIAGDHKDANEALTADRQAFTRAIQAATDRAGKLGELDKEAEREAYRSRSAKAYIKQFTEDIANSAANTSYIPTGYEALDGVLDGGLYEGLYIIGAISSLGKTTFIVQAADQMAAYGADILIFSLEMARSEIMAKSISRESFYVSLEQYGDSRAAKTTRGITTGKRWPNYSREEVAAIKQAISNYATYSENLYIMEGVGDIGVAQIREAVADHIRITGKKPVVIVDYLQLLAPNDPRSTDKQNMDKAVLELKRISRDYKTPVIAISSLNRQSYGAPVSMEAFKESGAIEYSSDVLIGLQAAGAGSADFNIDAAKQKDPRQIELKILKNRNGRTGGTLAFEYYPLFNLYREEKIRRQDAAPRARR